MRICLDLDGPIAQHGEGMWWIPESWADLAVVPGARHGIEQLIEDGHTLYLVTARPEHANTFQWLGRQGIHLPITHTRKKWEVLAHVYLDDSVGALQGLAKRRLTTVQWVTQNSVTTKANFHVSSWPQFVSLIRSGSVKGRIRRRPRVHR